MNARSIAAAVALVLAAFGCSDDDTSDPVAPEAITPETAAFPAAATAAPAFEQLSAGDFMTCGVTTAGAGYCWGHNFDGELGDGTNTPRTTPRAVVGGLTFRQVSAATVHSCGITTDYRAYCWGDNLFGELGNGTSSGSTTPVLVAGGHQFRQIETGEFYTCAVTSDNRAWCWGTSTTLGTGATEDARVPVAVAGGLTFRQVTTGQQHACGLTTGGAVYCWGTNIRGQIGDSTNATYRPLPTKVSGGRTYAQVDAGWNHTCAVATSERIFCWGDGRLGELGNGKAYLSFWPRRVSGDLSFARVTGGSGHTCAETTTNKAYCWGSNADGELGTGSTGANRLTPVAVTGGLLFRQVTAGTAFTCGKTGANVAYCWGNNEFGELGDGTKTNRPRPTAVAGAS